GAEVTIDGEKRLAQTPGRVAGLHAGRHRVSLRLQGYAPIDDVVDIYSNMVIDRELRPASVMLHIDVEPSTAELWLDGAAVGPLGPGGRSVAVQPGVHILRAQKKGFVEARQSVTVGIEGDSVKLKLEEEKKYGTVDLSSEPWGEIYLDGKDL